MMLIVGLLVVVVCTLGGYAAMGGKLLVLWQPFELVIIGGAAVGAFLIANPRDVAIAAARGFGRAMRGAKFKREHYLELLTMQYQVFKVAKTRGLLALEQHIEKPRESTLFAQFPLFFNETHAVTFLTDYLRLMTLGSDNPHEIEALMDEEIETHHHEATQVAHALQIMSDGLPALGIVAAVLGVIKTMGSITEPPEILGKLIGGALVGTFLGVWLSYGFIGPIASILKQIADAELKYLQCMKAGLLAHLHGSAPAISVEYARKALASEVRPSFYEVEEACAALPPA
ncbi:MAG TPA: flagellar motor stator protein MotA [Azospirillaceae bacterium]|nr:flagellar motor stator protein MotA [Azospirillaceae bacterium]